MLRRYLVRPLVALFLCSASILLFQHYNIYHLRLQTQFNFRPRSISPLALSMPVNFRQEPNHDFNPSLLPLPKTVLYAFDNITTAVQNGFTDDSFVLMAARRKSRMHNLPNGEHYSESAIVICIGKLLKHGDLDTPNHGTTISPGYQCVTPAREFAIHSHLKHPFGTDKLVDFGNYRRYFGPEDPRLFWGSGMNSHNPRRLRSIWLTDLRRSLPELDRFQPHIPLGFDQVELGPEFPQRKEPAETRGLGIVEKNWSPFVHDNRMYMQIDWINPRRVFRVNEDHMNNHVKIELIFSQNDFEQCAMQHVPRMHLNGPDVAVHQASNTLRVTLPSDETIFVSIIHVRPRSKAVNYTPYVVTWYSTGRHSSDKFKIRSINGPLGMPGFDHGEKIVFVTTINFLKHPFSLDMDRGLPETELLLSFGVSDNQGRVICIRMQDLLAGEVFCGNH